MREITFFGRGGQGAVVASEILAGAYFREGYHVQSFPSFGVERRGAPVTAFLRIDKEFIYLRSMIYRADIGVVLSRDIVDSPAFKPLLKNGSTILVNSGKAIDGLAGFDVSYVDAVAIALECGLGSAAQPLVNTAILGAYARVLGDLKIENLLSAVENSVPTKTNQNLDAVRKAYERVS
jgi:pyruvate ferredoxin oxidoreductase gamma subunit/2-oxoisovalerate ferredoxin oxidoreductase gamma subunit